jgi:hypothetical protein
MKAAAQIGIALFGMGALTAICGWLPVLVMAGADAAIVTAVAGMTASLLGAAIWFFCVP